MHNQDTLEAAEKAILFYLNSIFEQIHSQKMYMSLHDAPFGTPLPRRFLFLSPYAAVEHAYQALKRCHFQKSKLRDCLKYFLSLPTPKQGYENIKIQGSFLKYPQIICGMCGYWIKFKDYKQWLYQVEKGIKKTQLDEQQNMWMRKLGQRYSQNCSICFEPLRNRAPLIYRQLKQLKCGHAYHQSCIDTWTKDHPSCPICRASQAL